MDSVLDELGVDIRRAYNFDLAVLEEGRGRALVEQPVLEQAEVLQAVPLRPGLCVLCHTNSTAVSIGGTTCTKCVDIRCGGGRHVRHRIPRGRGSRVLEISCGIEAVDKGVSEFSGSSQTRRTRCDTHWQRPRTLLGKLIGLESEELSAHFECNG